MPTNKNPEDNPSYSLALPFYIDTDAYTDRDREMFVSGFEFCLIMDDIVSKLWRGTRPIHRENESRFRMVLGQKKVEFTITPHRGYAGCETWSQLTTYSHCQF